jgi:ribosomal RNA-processing protein 7
VGIVEIMDLKKNWEADKAKVEKLKESRRFKPY